MELIVGKTAGFCYGVKRAVEGARKILETEKNIYGLGEIVNNKEVIRELEKLGMKFADNINEVKDKVIIRAHGVSKEIYKLAKEKRIELIDYTCPNVIKIHEIVKEYANQEYYIFLLGTKEHPENIGTISYCKQHIAIIEQEGDVNKALEMLKTSKIKKVLLISQTTYSLGKFCIIKEMIKNKLPKNVELVVKNTICQATEIRQKETEKIAKKANAMIIIGGKNSSNTKKLYEIAKQYCKTVFWVENETELELDKIKPTDTVGIMAGASTPKESITKVIEEVKKVSS